jgi:hypothetical protein
MPKGRFGGRASKTFTGKAEAKMVPTTSPMRLSSEEGASAELHALAERFIKWIGEGPRYAHLDAPCSCTVAFRNGEYRARAFIGAEQFRLTGAYAGRSNKLILVFKPIAPSDFTFMEMSLPDAFTKLDQQFKTSVEDLVFEIEKCVTQKARVTAGLEQEKSDYSLDPRYGSW